MLLAGAAQALHLQLARQTIEVNEHLTPQPPAGRCRFWRAIQPMSEQVPLLTDAVHCRHNTRTAVSAAWPGSTVERRSMRLALLPRSGTCGFGGIVRFQLLYDHG